MKPQCAATVFSVRNVDEALKFYTEILGFSLDFKFGDYAGIKMGSVFIHLSQNHPNMRPPGSGAIYIFCDEVDEYYLHITGKGVRAEAPADQPYEMRDFRCEDPDGNQISFGAGTSKEAA